VNQGREPYAVDKEGIPLKRKRAAPKKRQRKREFEGVRGWVTV